MLSNKKSAGHGMWTVVLAVIAIITLTILTGWILIFKGGAYSTIPDKACLVSNYIANLGGTKAKCVAPGTLQPIRFCRTREAEIDPTDWSKCKGDPQLSMLKNTDVQAAAKRCAATQILDLSRRCWHMAGSGELSPCSFMCFTGVVELGRDHKGKIDKTELSTDYAKKLRAELGCGAWTTEEQCLLKQKSMCADAVSRLTDKLITRTTRSTTFQYYIDIVKKGYLSNCAKKDVTIKQGEVMEELFGEKTMTTSSVKSILGGKIDTDKEHCGDTYSRIAEAIESAKVYSSRVHEVDSEIDSILKEYVGGGESVDREDLEPGESSGLQYGEVSDRLDYISNAAQSYTTGIPEMSAIDGDYLAELAREVNVTVGSRVEDETYYEALGEKNVEMLYFHKIYPHSMFELAFCGGAQTGSGVLAQGNCNIFMEKHIQIAALGEGAGGRMRGESPYCNIADDLIPMKEDPVSKFCEGMFWKASTTVQ